MNALCTAVIAALTGTQWSEIDNQSRFMIGVAITLNWTGTIMAFISKNAKKIESGQIPDNGGTQFITKPSTPTESK